MLTNISFNKADKNTTLPNRVALKSFIEKQLGKEGLKVECLQYVFCSDKYLLDINKTFLKHNYYTDIISFDLSEHKGTLIADVYISVDRVKENAKTLKVPYKQELLRVLFHGALHFCGYKDKKLADAKKMRSMEDKWIKSYLKTFHVERSK
jgi:rRNA maturation RNase YbeY